MLCVLPGIYVLANVCLLGSVLMMEDVRGRAALKRSRALYKRSRRTVIAIVLIHIGAPILMTTVAALLIVAVVKALNPSVSIQFLECADFGVRRLDGALVRGG
jgi:hypothetical protein